MSNIGIGAYTPQDAREIKRRVLKDDRTVPSPFAYTEKDKLGWHYGILKETLDPAYCDPLTEYTQATAAVLMYIPLTNDLSMEEVIPEEFYVTLTNRSPYVSLAVGDLVLFRWVVKEWAVIGPPIKRLQCVMQENLAAAVDTQDDPSTGQAKILIKNAAGDMKLLSTEITIVNRFMNISILASTYFKAEYIDNEWQPYAADCPGTSSFSSSDVGSSC